MSARRGHSQTRTYERGEHTEAMEFLRKQRPLGSGNSLSQAVLIHTAQTTDSAMPAQSSISAGFEALRHN